MSDVFDRVAPVKPAQERAPVDRYDGSGGESSTPPAEEGDQDAEDRSTARQQDRNWADRFKRWADPVLTKNIVFDLLEDQETFPNGSAIVERIGPLVCRQTALDDQSRDHYIRKNKEAMRLAMQVAEAKTQPWEGASNIIYPLITMAALQFSARAFPAIVPGPDIVKGKIEGDDPPIPLLEKDPQTGQPLVDPQTGQPKPIAGPDGQPVLSHPRQENADKIASHMSWQFISEQDEWVPDTDRLLIILPIAGCIFRKTFFDSSLMRNGSTLVFASKLIINYYAKSMASAPRITEEIEKYPHEIKELEMAGIWRKITYGIPPGADGEDEDAPHVFYEQQRRYDLDGDGYTEPYVCTVHKDTQQVVRITAAYDPETVHFSKRTNRIVRIDRVEYHTKYDFLPNPDGGIYGVGFGELLSPINHSIDTALNQMFDAGKLANMGGGFVGKGLGLNAGTIKFRPGEYKAVNSIGSSVRDSVVPLVFPGPSTTMFQLLSFLVQAGKEMSANTEVLSGNQTQSNVPATTTLALIEQGLKVFTGVYKRIYLALKSEFEKQKRLNRLYLDQEQSYQAGDQWKTIKQQDYMVGAAVEPISDPTMVSEMQELARAEFLKGFLADPFFNGKVLRETILKAARVRNVEALLTTQAPQVDPLKLEALNMQRMVAKATALERMTQGIKNLADADKAVTENFTNWIVSEWQILQGMMEQMNGGAAQPGEPGAGGPADGGGPASGGPGPGVLGGGLPGLAAPPGN